MCRDRRACNSSEVSFLINGEVKRDGTEVWVIVKDGDICILRTRIIDITFDLNIVITFCLRKDLPNFFIYGRKND